MPIDPPIFPRIELDEEASATATFLYADLVPPKPRVHPVTVNLEPWMLEGIGQIVMLWATAEWMLTGIAARYMGYDRKESRQRLTGRADSAIAELRCCFAMSKQQAPEILDVIERESVALADLRNIIAHGIWLKKSAEKVVLQRMSGAWEVSGKAVGSKKVTPGEDDVPPEWFKGQAARIQQFITDTQQLKREIEALVAGR